MKGIIKSLALLLPLTTALGISATGQSKLWDLPVNRRNISIGFNIKTGDKKTLFSVSTDAALINALYKIPSSIDKLIDNLTPYLYDGSYDSGQKEFTLKGLFLGENLKDITVFSARLFIKPGSFGATSSMRLKIDPLSKKPFCQGDFSAFIQLAECKLAFLPVAVQCFLDLPIYSYNSDSPDVFFGALYDDLTSPDNAVSAKEGDETSSFDKERWTLFFLERLTVELAIF